MCQLHQSYIEKSNENWKCAKELLERDCTYPDVIASRMYYAMFFLIKHEMVLNNDDKNLADDMKMSDADATGVHDLARKYINNYLVSLTNDLKLGRNWAKLLSLRIKADYKRQPVTCDEINDTYDIWNVIRERWLSSLSQHRRISV